MVLCNLNEIIKTNRPIKVVEIAPKISTINENYKRHEGHAQVT